jgi:phosphoribosylformimino-5-aminoimidazole carboxamide ribotide isomerase
MFRPCIDLHSGKVKQIVGGSLSDQPETLRTNFVADHPAAWFADLYRQDNLKGGHVILLDQTEANHTAAHEALGAFPGGLQIGGGICLDNATQYLDAGASHVIVTSWVFHDGQLDLDRLTSLVQKIGASRLVLDLSCRKKDGKYYVVTDRWTRFTDLEVNAETLKRLSKHCDEFLIHGVDVEGLRQGMDLELIRIVANADAAPTTYAGGARSLDDFKTVHEISQGRVGLTMGSALDIFGGDVSYQEVVSLHRQNSAPGK